MAKISKKISIVSRSREVLTVRGYRQIAGDICPLCGSKLTKPLKMASQPAVESASPKKRTRKPRKEEPK